MCSSRCRHVELNVIATMCANRRCVGGKANGGNGTSERVGAITTREGIGVCGAAMMKGQTGCACDHGITWSFVRARGQLHVRACVCACECVHAFRRRKARSAGHVELPWYQLQAQGSRVGSHRLTAAAELEKGRKKEKTNLALVQKHRQLKVTCNLQLCRECGLATTGGQRVSSRGQTLLDLGKKP